MKRFSILLLIVLLTVAVLVLVAGAARTLAAAPEAKCTYEADKIVCTIAEGGGIGSVLVQEYTAQGPNVTVDNSYDGCPAEVTVSWMPLVPDYEISVGVCGGATEKIVHFADMNHEPLGEATLSLSPGGLLALTFDREGDDGIGVDVGEASSWSGLVLPEPPPSGGSFTAAAFAAGEADPIAEIQYGPTMTDVIVYLPDDKHSVALYNGDMLVHSAEGMPDGSKYVTLSSPFCQGNTVPRSCVPRLTFGLDQVGHGFFWEISLPQPVTLTIPSGMVQGDRLRFSDSQSPRFPLSINRMQLIGTELLRLTLFDEYIAPPLPANATLLPSLQGGAGPADPYGFDALTKYMESDPPVGEEMKIDDNLVVRVVGTGELVEEMVVEPEPGDIPDDGVPDPDEPPVPTMDQTLRVFNTTLQKEFEIQVGGPLLEQLMRMMPGTGARPPGSVAVGVDRLLALERPPTVNGLSGGVDNRVNLTGTTWWPWRTIVHFSNNCSGTLVGPRHILTAAHCINKRGTNQWYSFTATPGRNGDEKPFGDAPMDPNPQPGDPFRWYFTPSGWRTINCTGSCFEASRFDWGLIVIPEYLGYQTGWMGFVARPASQLNPQAHFNRGYPACNTGKPNVPSGCDYGELYGDTQTCSLGNYSYPDSNGWNRLIRNSCDLSGGHSGSAAYHYYYDPYLGQTVPVVAMVEIWEHCYTCSASDLTPNTARRLTPGSIDVILFFRQWKP